MTAQISLTDLTSGFPSGIGAGPYAKTADMKIVIVFVGEFFDLVVAFEKIETVFADGVGRTGEHAIAAVPALVGNRRIGFQGNIREDRCQPDPRPEFGMDKEVIFAPEAESGQQPYMPMRDVGILLFPIDYI